MKPFTVLTILLLALSVIGGGCISTTDYVYSGGTTEYTSTSLSGFADKAPGAKFVRGDIVQSSIPKETRSVDSGVLITGVSADMYQYQMVARTSPSNPWVIYYGFSGTCKFSDIETEYGKLVGHADPDSLITIIYHDEDSTKSAGRGELQIESYKLERGGYGTMNIVGFAENVGGRRISWGTIEVKFYDRTGCLVGKSADFIQDLDPGETWKFNVMYYDTDGSVTSYKLGVGTVY